MKSVNRPRVRTVTGKVRNMRTGLRKALRSPSTSAATKTAGQLSRVTPETIWATTRSAVLLTTHLTSRYFILFSTKDLAGRRREGERGGRFSFIPYPYGNGDRQNCKSAGFEMQSVDLPV